MIRIYAYYSCGGYKDMYLGTDDETTGESYYLPLLPIWKKNNKTEQIEKTHNLLQVKLITKEEAYGFPPECRVMFSHGGYKAMHRTLTSGAVCFCIRDIFNGAKDEENRDIPFHFLLIAEGRESIKKLDEFALSYIGNWNLIETQLGRCISYDPYINGIKFNLDSIKESIYNSPASSIPIAHTRGKIISIKVSSRAHAGKALQEQNITADAVNAFYDNSGIFNGAIPYMRPSTIPPGTTRVNVFDENKNNETTRREPAIPIVLPGKSIETHKDENPSPVETAVVPPREQEQIKRETETPYHEENDTEKQISDKLNKIEQMLQELSKLTSEITPINNRLQKLSEEVEKIIAFQNKQEEERRLIEKPSQNNLYSKGIIKDLTILIAGIILGRIIF